MTPTRRAVLFTGAATASAALLPLPSPAAAASGSPAGPGALPAATPPLASYWYPDSLPAGEPGEGITWRSLREWRAEDDADLAFNASTVPLAPRFAPAPVNTTARTCQARIQSLVSFGPTAGNPSQGSPTADYYALTHWAYLDELVFWGGSAGEGLIPRPTPPSWTPPTVTGCASSATSSCRPSSTAVSSGGPGTWSEKTRTGTVRSPSGWSRWPPRTASTAGS